MKFLYTATSKYDKTDGLSWDKYIEWSQLTHLTELVSLDNKVLVEPDYENADDWNFIHLIDNFQTGFFTTIDFVLKRLRTQSKFNLLAIALEPDHDCKSIFFDDYEFVGYELFDIDCGISALTNCGGFDETFLSSDLNDKGLIDDFAKAYDIRKRLLENNPDEPHADTNVIAVWRHKTIGR